MGGIANLWSDITSDDTFKSITGSAGSLATGILSSTASVFKNIFSGASSLLSGDFLYVIIGGVVLIGGVYVYTQVKTK